MSCGACASILENFLNQDKRIKEAKVNFSTSMAQISTYQPIKARKIEHIIQEVGFDGKQVQQIFFKPPPKLNKNYFKAAKLNLMASLFILGIQLIGVIPSPFSFIGKLTALVLGAGVSGLMWKTSKDIYKDAFGKARQGHLNMNTLVALGTLSALFFSMCMAFLPFLFPLGALHYHFLAIPMILTGVNFGRGLREKAQSKAQGAMRTIRQEFFKLQPQMARVVQAHDKGFLKTSSRTSHPPSSPTCQQVALANIKKGDWIWVKKNERFPVEGRILSQKNTYVDESVFTGESKNVQKRVGSKVLSGTLNMGESVIIRASCAGKKTQLIRLLNQVSQGSYQKSTLSAKVDKIAPYFVPGVILIAALTGLGWALFGPIQYAIACVMAVLLCACPCSLSLATPISTAIAYHKLFSKGIVIKEITALEKASQIDTIVLDKTGTLTSPQVDLAGMYSQNLPISKHKLIDWITQLESYSDHPIAKAFGRLPQKVSPSKVDIKKLQKSENGLSAQMGSLHIALGNEGFIESTLKAKIPKVFKEKLHTLSQKGDTPILVSIDNQVCAILPLTHTLNPGVKKAVKSLKQMNKKVIMLTGDHQKTAQVLAKQLKIEVQAQATPASKKAYIRALQKKGNVVGFVGDGVNDFLAAKAADVSFAIDAWTSASCCSDIILRNQLEQVVHTLKGAQLTQHNIHQNLRFSFGYNLVALSLATGIFYPILGIVLNPVLAGGLMVLSSLFVVTNAYRLNFKMDSLTGTSISKPKINHLPKGSKATGQPKVVQIKKPSIHATKVVNRPKITFTTHKARK